MNSGKQAARLNPPAVPAITGRAVSPVTFVVGLVLLGLCAALSLALGQEHLTGLHLPGCGGGSPCEQAANSVWGKVPWLNWPVSYVGLAYFLGLLVAWPAMRRGVPAAVRWLVRLGLLGSLGFVAIMIHGGYVCPYCLATHIGNFAFWILLEGFTRAARADARTRRPLAALGATFIVATALLAAVEFREKGVVRAADEAQANASKDAILRQAAQGPATPLPGREEQGEGAVPGRTQTPTTLAAGPPGQATTASPRGSAGVSPSQPAPGGFTGRYRLGPEEAVLRIVVFMDYQCNGCHLLELELKKAMEQHPEIALSVKQWPGCVDCNPYVTEHNHVNACRAACAAETAGILHGNDGFWQMHFWLFDHSGRFTDEELREALKEFGYDPAQFELVMNNPATLELIKGDIEEGNDLALATTPLIYINGVEFKGWGTPGTLTRVIEQVFSGPTRIQPKTAEADHPAPPLEKFVQDWKQQRVRELPPGARWTLGPADATLKIVVWGDQQQPKTAMADEVIRQFMTEHAQVQYTFRHFPLDPQCNADFTQKEQYPLACLAARAAEAAGQLGGLDAFWKMHDWLVKNQAQLSDEPLQAAAASLGLDALAFSAALADPAIDSAVAADIAAAKEVNLQNAPLIFLNGRLVPRWRHGEKALLEPILEAAAKP